jgi:hypothetical protein
MLFGRHYHWAVLSVTRFSSKPLPIGIDTGLCHRLCAACALAHVTTATIATSIRNLSRSTSSQEVTVSCPNFLPQRGRSDDEKNR